MKKGNELFEALNCINYKSKPKFDLSKVNGYMLSLWLAQDKNLIGYVNKLNPYIFNLKNKLMFKYFYKIIPKRKRFIKWTKKEKIETPKDIEYLCQKYGISEREAKISLNKKTKGE